MKLSDVCERGPDIYPSLHEIERKVLHNLSLYPPSSPDELTTRVLDVLNPLQMLDDRLKRKIVASAMEEWFPR